MVAPLEIFLDYCDDALAKSSHQVDPLSWLEKVDVATRAKMCSYCRSPHKMPWGLALKRAMVELQYEWNTLRAGQTENITQSEELRLVEADSAKSERPGRAARPATRKDRYRSRRRGPMAQAAKDAVRFRTATFLKGNKQLCKSWNDARGCTTNPNKCPDKSQHLCDVIKKDGKICASSEHSRRQHPKVDAI